MQSPIDPEKVWMGLGATESIIRAQYVRRWHLVPMSMPQSVAEHQYNVAMLLMSLPAQEGIDVPAAVAWAMVHDLPENVTGDVPTHIKTLSPAIKTELEEIESEVMGEEWCKLHDEFISAGYATRIAFKACDLADGLRMCKYALNEGMRRGLTEQYTAALRGLAEKGLTPANYEHLLEYARLG